MKSLSFEARTLLACFAFFVVVAVGTNYHYVVEYMFSDEMVYYMMAQSLSADHDLKYTQADLQRVYEEGWNAGPIGVFLNKTEDGAIYFSKYFIYSWALAPFLALFGFNGFMLFHVVLFFLCLTMGWLYLRQFNPSRLAFAAAMAFFLLSASVLYIFWLTPEIFNMFCITCGLFLWLYRGEGQRVRLRGQRIVSRRAALFGKAADALNWLIFTPQGRRYLAPLPLAMAAMSKLPNILFFLPLLADALFIGENEPQKSPDDAPLTTRQKLRRIVLPRATRLIALGLVFAGMVGVLFLLQYRYTGQTNPYSGDRRTFVSQFPFDSTEDSWERGIRMSSEDYFTKAFFFHPKTLLFNVYYYLFGRFTGVLPYFCCSFLALYWFVRPFFRRRRSDMSFADSADSKERLRRIFLLLTILASIGTYIIMMPINYHGGGGAFGNRYFVNIYPAFLFLVTAMSGIWPLIAACAVSLAFLAPSFANPFDASFFPAPHAFRYPFRLLPVELTLIETLPTNLSANLVQTAGDTQGILHKLSFFDDAAVDLSPYEFLVRGGKETQAALRTYRQQQHVVFTVINKAAANQVDVSMSGQTVSMAFSRPNERRTAVFPLKEYLPYFSASLHPFAVRSHSGAIPRFHPDAHSPDHRYLGCRVTLSFDPVDVGKAYVANGQAAEAIAALQPAAQAQPDDAALRYVLGRAYQQAGDHQAALREFEQARRHLTGFRDAFAAKLLQQKNNRMPRIVFSQSQNDTLLLRYEAEDLPHTTGEAYAADELSNRRAMAFNPAVHAPGYIAYGQYLELPAGDYQVNFRMKVADSPDIPAKAWNHIAVFLDAYSTQEGIAAEKIVRLDPQQRGQFGRHVIYSMPVSLPRAQTLEFRAKATGYAPISLDAIEITPLLPVQLLESIGVSTARLERWEDAARAFEMAGDENLHTADEIQTAYLQTLIHLKRWDAASSLLRQSDASAQGHSGLWTHLFPLLAELPQALRQDAESVMAAFAPSSRLNMDFGGQLRFLGCHLSANALKPGEQAVIRYFWEALSPMAADYTIFVHVTRRDTSVTRLTLEKIAQRLGRTPTRFFQQDHTPFGGGYPTNRWLPGELIRYDYLLTAPSGLAPGTYDIRLGVYDSRTGKRLQTSAGDSVNIGDLTILPD